MSLPSRITLRLLLNTAFTGALVFFCTTIFTLRGGFPALLITSFLLTFLDCAARPFLAFLAFPLRLILTLLNILVLNGLFLGLLVLLLQSFPPSLLTLTISSTFRDVLFLIILFAIRDGVLRTVVR